jgi:flagellar hook-length control protein FliK
LAQERDLRSQDDASVPQAPSAAADTSQTPASKVSAEASTLESAPLVDAEAPDGGGIAVVAGQPPLPQESIAALDAADWVLGLEPIATADARLNQTASEFAVVPPEGMTAAFAGARFPFAAHSTAFAMPSTQSVHNVITGPLVDSLVPVRPDALTQGLANHAATDAKALESVANLPLSVVQSLGLRLMPGDASLKAAQASAGVDPAVGIGYSAGPQSAVFSRNGKLAETPASTSFLNRLPAVGQLLAASDLGAGPVSAIDQSALESSPASSSTPMLLSLPGLASRQAADELAVSVRFTTSVTPQSPQWAQQIADRAAWMAGQKIQEADIQLNPEELGQIHIKVSVQQEQVAVAFWVANSQVRESLDQSLVKLREVFEGQGLELVQADVHDQRRQQQARDEDDPDETAVADKAASLKQVVSLGGVDQFA